MKNIDKRVKKLLKEKGVPSINSEKFRLYNHEDDNRIIEDFDWLLGRTVQKDTYPGVWVIGYNEHPAYNERDESVAVMFEDLKTGREFWCHVPGNYFTPHTIGRLMGIEELENDWTEYEDG